MKITPLGWLNFAAVAALFIVSYPQRDWPARQFERLVEPGALTAVRSWQFLHGGDSGAASIDEASDLVVINFTNGDGDSSLLRRHVQGLQRRSDGSRRLVLAGVPIGAIDENRSTQYDGLATSASVMAPGWLGPERCPNSRLRSVWFWQEAWKRLLYRGPGSQLDRIIAAGFDGAYLSHIGAYQQHLGERPSAARDMVDLVSDFAITARRLKPGFLIVPEGGETLLNNAGYRGVIDGFAVQCLIFDGSTEGEPNGYDAVARSGRLLQALRQHGKPVLVVERLSDPNRMDEVRSILRRHGFAAAFEQQPLASYDPKEFNTPDEMTGCL